MSIAVINRLKPIQVEHHHGKTTSLFAALVDQGIQVQVCIAPVVGSCQRVRDSLNHRIAHILAQLIGIQFSTQKRSQARGQFDKIDRA